MWGLQVMLLLASVKLMKVGHTWNVGCSIVQFVMFVWNSVKATYVNSEESVRATSGE